MQLTPTFTISERFVNALRLAGEVHATQLRKGTPLP
jgi:hypothetical protein